MKLLTFAVPCYNSQAYMEHCVETLLEGGDDVEIILVDDGSKDDTGAIADRYAAQYPRYRPGGAPGKQGPRRGGQSGLRRAQGLYYKVVDSDDWADVDALRKVIAKLREFSQMEHPVDMLVCNYVYEHVEDQTQKVMRYTNVFPQNRVFTWDEIGRFRPSQYLLMHSVFYRTQLLRRLRPGASQAHLLCGQHLCLPTPSLVKTLYYMDLDFYPLLHRPGRSKRERAGDGEAGGPAAPGDPDHDRLPQPEGASPQHRRLSRYMFNYLSMMMTISSVFLIIDGSPEALGKKTELWEYLRTVDSGIYHKMKYRSISAVGNFPGYQGRKLSVRLYRLARRIYKFN